MLAETAAGRVPQPREHLRADVWRGARRGARRGTGAFHAAFSAVCAANASGASRPFWRRARRACQATTGPVGARRARRSVRRDARRSARRDAWRSARRSARRDARRDARRRAHLATRTLPLRRAHFHVPQCLVDAAHSVRDTPGRARRRRGAAAYRCSNGARSREICNLKRRIGSRPSTACELKLQLFTPTSPSVKALQDGLADTGLVPLCRVVPPFGMLFKVLNAKVDLCKRGVERFIAERARCLCCDVHCDWRRGPGCVRCQRHTRAAWPRTRCSHMAQSR